MVTTKGSLNAGLISQRAIFMPGGKVSTNGLSSARPSTEQLTLDSRECCVSCFTKYEMSSAVRDDVTTLRKKKMSC